MLYGMTNLTRSITAHNLEEMEKILSSNPASIETIENGWLPIEWAERTGNVVTIMRLVRLANIENTHYTKVLRSYVRMYSTNYFGGGSIRSATEQIWEQTIEGKPPRPHSKDESEIHLTEKTRLDIKYFLEKIGIKSVDQLLELTN
jgi:hypothetical protein